MVKEYVFNIIIMSAQHGDFTNGLMCAKKRGVYHLQVSGKDSFFVMYRRCNNHNIFMAYLRADGRIVFGLRKNELRDRKYIKSNLSR